jgi:hypothetical protein
MSELQPKYLVQVCESRNGDWWPVATLGVMEDGRAALNGAAGIEGRIYMPLLAATKKAAINLAKQKLVRAVVQGIADVKLTKGEEE